MTTKRVSGPPSHVPSGCTAGPQNPHCRDQAKTCRAAPRVVFGQPERRFGERQVRGVETEAGDHQSA
jgi:hypothetical protein